MESLSIQELRQALRERGANSQGSKKQLLQRLTEQSAFPSAASSSSSLVGGSSHGIGAKVRVTVQKGRGSGSIVVPVLCDPALAPEHHLQTMLQRAANKFLYKPTHLYAIGGHPDTGHSGGGIELTSDNLREFLRDGLVILATTQAKRSTAHAITATPAGAVLSTVQSADSSPHPAGSSSSEHKLSNSDSGSGSCSSVENELELEMAERASLKSFDGDSLYSYEYDLVSVPIASSASASASSTSAPASAAVAAHDERAPRTSLKKKGWKWMLPREGDNQHVDEQKHQQPVTPMLSLAMQFMPTPAFLPALPHSHSNHLCPSSSTPVALSSSPPGPPHVLSLMVEIELSRGGQPAFCACCDSNCGIESVAFPAPVPAPQPLPLPVAPSQPPQPASSASTTAPSPSPALVRAHSTPTPAPIPVAASSSPPAVAPASLEQQARILDLERSQRRLEGSLKAYLKSDLELRAKVETLTAGASTLPGLEEAYRSLTLSTALREKEHTKACWERDRLKMKNRALMDQNNQLKQDAEALVALRKEYAALQTQLAHLSGSNVNASTSPSVLQDLLLQHTLAIQRVHGQMSANIARDKRDLTEARQCKVCMSRPSDTILLPCSHFVLCGHCASSVSRCPICRAQVHDKRPVYM